MCLSHPPKKYSNFSSVRLRLRIRFSSTVVRCRCPHQNHSKPRPARLLSNTNMAFDWNCLPAYTPNNTEYFLTLEMTWLLAVGLICRATAIYDLLGGTSKPVYHYPERADIDNPCSWQCATKAARSVSTDSSVPIRTPTTSCQGGTLACFASWAVEYGKHGLPHPDDL